ncbi:MAG: alpha/beta hydrolase, partial [Kibdelosporangium sp.]
SAHVFGHSSGAILALAAAQHGLPISKLAVYEPPYVIEGTRTRAGDDLADRLKASTREDAVTLFLTEAVGVPAPVVDGMRGGPAWGWLTGLAHTLSYDVTICGPGARLPIERLATIDTPTLAIGGSASAGWMTAAAQAVADTVPGGRYVELAGHDHDVLNQPEALRAILFEYFA